MAGVKIFSSEGKPLQLGERAGQGGEATVYRIAGQPERLAKLYTRGPRPEYPAKLAWMAAHPPENPTQRYHHASLAWPEELLFADGKRLIGYTMPFIQGAVSILDVFNPRRRLQTLPDFDGRYLHRAARNLAAALGALHRNGYVVGDLNESNVLVTPSALVTMIDTDSFQVEEDRDGQTIVHFCPVGKLEYTPPELHGQDLDRVRRLPEHDAFSLATLIFQLLMDGNHPFRAQWLGKGEPPPLESRIAQGSFPYSAKPPGPVAPPLHAPALERLHPALAALMLQCFVDGHSDPAARPSPEAWERALAASETALITCSEKHVYSNHLPACPHCQAEAERRERMAAPARRRGGARTGKAQPAARRPKPQPAAGTRPPGHQPPGRAAGRGRSTTRPAGRPAAAPPPRPASTGPSPARGVSTNVVKWVVKSAAQSLPVNTPAATGARPRSFQENFLRNLARNSPLMKTSPAGAPATATPSGGSAAPAGAPPASNPSVGSASSPRPPAWRTPRPAGTSAQVFSAAGRRLLLTRAVALKSLTNGSGFGALAGITASAVIALAAGALENPLTWLLLFSLGGAWGALARGWQPGRRSGEWITMHVGWGRFLQVAGLLVGAVLGAALLGIPAPWLICPSVFGLLGGGYLGRLAGRKLWISGAHLNWERIWAVTSTAAAAVAGGLFVRWIGAGPVGLQLAEWSEMLSPWILAETESLALVWLATGALAGAVGGAVSGFLTDLIARVFGLAQ